MTMNSDNPSCGGLDKLSYEMTLDELEWNAIYTTSKRHKNVREVPSKDIEWIWLIRQIDIYNL